MGLSTEQKQILTQIRVSEDFQKIIANSLGDNGNPHPQTKRDFLDLIADHLQSIEQNLHALRLKLIERNNEMVKMQDRLKQIDSVLKKEYPMLIEVPEQMHQAALEGMQTKITELEEDIKNHWVEATALWRIADQIFSNPTLFRVKISIEHLKHAFNTRNLAIVEMFKWHNPAFFDSHPSLILKYLAWFFGTISGAFLGSIAGSINGAKLGFAKTPKLFGFLMAFLDAIAGIFQGGGVGAATGAKVGLATGNAFLAAKLAYQGASLNPLHDARGSVRNQAVELKIHEAYFEAAFKRWEESPHSHASGGASKS